MTSEYGYTTVAGLETFTGRDYSAINASYTDSVIEAQISTAENIINGYCGQSWTTIPAVITTATKIIAGRLMTNMLIRDGYMDRANPDKPEYSLLTSEVKALLDPYRDEGSDEESSWIIKG